VTIIVTGVGAVTALGRTARETFDRISRGERGFREISLFDPGEVRSRIVAEVIELGPTVDPSVSRTSELALMAAREAISDAKLDVRSRRVGLVLGGTTAGMFETESLLATLLSTETARGSERDAALSRMLNHPLSAPTDRLVRELGPFARARSMSSACSSGANALAVAATWLELGVVDAVLCGAADSLCRVIVSGFSALGALDPNGARPFDARRRGLTLGEGAGMLVLERVDDRPEDAVRRERALCTLLGWASCSEAHHITNPEETGEAPLAAMRGALARAGLRSKDVDYVNAHGTGTPLNDPMETRALGRLFEADLPRVPVSSQKGMIGHTLAAAGAIEAVLTALAIDREIVPPTGGLEEVDAQCTLTHVFSAERRPIGTAISSSFGFGGMDTALVFGRRDRVAPAPRMKRTVVVTGISAVTPAGIFEGTGVADVPTVAASRMTVTIPDDALDPARARRLDRASRIAAVACGRALGVPRTAAEPTPQRVGVALGIAFGPIDATAEFMRRLRDKGARLVRPADFPSLVPSSPAGHVSIYLGLTGPALVVADVAVSGECALAQACELIASGDADRVCAGAVEERSTIVEEVLSTVFGSARDATKPRREGGAAVALASADVGVPALARLGDVMSFRDVEPNDRSTHDENIATMLAGLPPPPDGALVVLGGMGARAEELVLRSAWSRCPRIVCADECGAHEAAGSIAVAVAAAKVARGDATAALFLGSSRGWGYAGTAWPPDRPP
jgi:3-oxoacyl-[acyl-carrier-protein] synthase II